MKINAVKCCFSLCSFILSFALPLSVFSQDPAYIKYFNQEDLEVENIDKAFYKRNYYLKEPQDSTTSSMQFLVKEYYTTGIVKLIGEVNVFRGVETFFGDIKYYDINGKIIRSDSLSTLGVKFGRAYSFYKNRQLKQEVLYTYQKHGPHQMQLTHNEINFETIYNKGQLLNYSDSIGKPLVVNGNGFVKLNNKYLDDEVIEEGSYVNGFKNGKWLVKSLKDGKSYEEEYKNGKLVKGILFSEGKKIRYNKILIEPKFPKFESKLKLENYKPSNVAISYNSLYLSIENYLLQQGFKYSFNNLIGLDGQFCRFKLIIDENGKIETLAAKNLVPKEVVDELEKELRKIKYIEPGYYRGQKTRMEYPDFSLKLTY